MPSTISRPVRLAGGLIYVNSAMPGFSRVKRGTSFRYRDVKGGWLYDADEISRIRSLAIPPAYQKVWICPLPNGHLQATGVDARGRTQYRYHADWRALKDESKFERLEAFGTALPKIRARVARDLSGNGARTLSRELVLAALVRLLDTTYLRIGNEEYAAANGSYGLTTLRNKHVDIRDDEVKLHFRGKSGVLHEAKLSDPRVAKVIRRCQQLPGQVLFQYAGDDGAAHTLSSSDVNDYLRDAAGDNFTAKDFRTWHGTVQALELTRLACGRADTEEVSQQARFNAKEIINQVAKRLGNTPAVCKKAYVHPAVLSIGDVLAENPEMLKESWLEIERKTKSIRRLYVTEARLLIFLRHHRQKPKKNQMRKKA